MEKGKGIKYRVGDLIRESGLPRIRHLMNKYKFSKRGKWIAPSLVLLFFLILFSAGGAVVIALIAVFLFVALGIAGGMYFFTYGLLHFLDIGRDEKRHVYAVFLPIFIFIFALPLVPATLGGGLTGSTNPLYVGVLFIYMLIVLLPIILTLFINSGFFAAVTAHEFIMKRFKRLGKSRGFQISVLIFLMVFLTLMLVISLLTSQHPTKDMHGAFLLFIPLTLLFPFFIAILGYSKSIGMFTRVRPMPEKSEIAFFLGVLIYSVFAYLISIFVLIILVSNIDNPVVQLAAIDFTLGFFLTIYYFTSILGVLSVGSMRVIKMMVEEKKEVLAEMKDMKQELKREMKL